MQLILAKRIFQGREIVEVEYVSIACCSQLLWVKYQLEVYSSIENNIPVYCDNTNAINLPKNPMNTAGTLGLQPS